MKGIYLPLQQVNLIFDKKKTFVIKAHEILGFDKQPLLLLSKNKVCGIIELSSAKKINKADLVKNKDAYQLSEKDIEKYWKGKDTFFTYAVTVIQEFNFSLLWKQSGKEKTFIDSVEVIPSVNISIPLEKVTPEHTKFLDKEQQNGLRQRIALLAKNNIVTDEQKQNLINILDNKAPDVPTIKPDADDTALKTKFVPQFVLQAEFTQLNPEHKDTGFYDLLTIKGKPSYFMRIQENETTVQLWKLKIEDISRFERVEAEYKGNQSPIFMKTAKDKTFVVNIGAGITKFFTLDSGMIELKRLSDKALEMKIAGKFVKGQYVISRRVDTQPFMFEKLGSY